MNHNLLRTLSLRAFFLLTIAYIGGLAGQLALAQSAPAGEYNLFKEVAAKKDTIVWKNAPDNLIPAQVCTLLQICAGSPDKLIVLAPATEGGQKVGRGLFLTKMQDPKHSEALVLLNQSLDVYFFLLSPDGSLQKAAYRQSGKSWLIIANSLARPLFDKDEKIWHDRIAQLGGAATAPAKPAGAAAQ